MHLCALVEDEDRREGLHFFSFFIFLFFLACAKLFSVIFFFPILESFTLFDTISVLFLRFSSLSSFLAKISSLRHPAYIAEERIIVRKILVRFL